jgi:hypothetical protein
MTKAAVTHKTTEHVKKTTKVAAAQEMAKQTEETTKTVVAKETTKQTKREKMWPSHEKQQLDVVHTGLAKKNSKLVTQLMHDGHATLHMCPYRRRRAGCFYFVLPRINCHFQPSS